MITASPDTLAERRRAAGAQSIELGDNRARLRSTVQAGGGPIELARRCRSAPLAALVSGQGGGSDGLYLDHGHAARRSTRISMTLSLGVGGRLVRAIHFVRCAGPQQPARLRTSSDRAQSSAET
jgi:hypothetical protein